MTSSALRLFPFLGSLLPTSSEAIGIEPLLYACVQLLSLLLSASYTTQGFPNLEAKDGRCHPHLKWPGCCSLNIA